MFSYKQVVADRVKIPPKGPSVADISRSKISMDSLSRAVERSRSVVFKLFSAPHKELSLT